MHWAVWDFLTTMTKTTCWWGGGRLVNLKNVKYYPVKPIGNIWLLYKQADTAFSVILCKKWLLISSTIFQILFKFMYARHQCKKMDILKYSIGPLLAIWLQFENPNWGLTHPSTSEFFLDFSIFFQLYKVGELPWSYLHCEMLLSDSGTTDHSKWNFEHVSFHCVLHLPAHFSVVPKLYHSFVSFENIQKEAKSVRCEISEL